MSFIDKIKEEAKKDIKTIVLPESEDIRVLQAAQTIISENIANIVLIGDAKIIKETALKNNLDLSGVTIINPNTFDNFSKYANDLYELRKNKGMTLNQAKKILKDNSRYFATMMVKEGDADGFVSGASHPTSDTLKPALQILKTAPNTKLVSAFFVMVLPDKEFGEDGVFVFADCGLNEYPDADALSEATSLLKSKEPDLICDGEIQLDAAIIPEVAKLKAPNSNLKGKANILIFPDLDAGNIGYKLTQRFGHAEAYGPLCQGTSRPVNDLSRGCSASDIVGVVAITAVQAQHQSK